MPKDREHTRGYGASHPVLLGDTYDDRGQLIGARYQYDTYVPNESYDYDGNGNQTGFDLAEYNRPEVADGFTYSYDAEGNRTRRTNNVTGAYTLYSWDQRNRLTQVREYNAQDVLLHTISHKYDAQNRWIERNVDGVVTRFVYDGDQIVLALDGSNQVTNRYLWGPAVDMLLAEETVTSSSATALWALGDHQNSLRDYVTYDGTTVEDHLVYNAFGQPLSTAAVDHLFGFTGRPTDHATGLQNNLHRWYDSDLHQWLSEDPMGFAAGDANLRRYVSNDPVNNIDPNGLDEISYPWFGFDGPAYYTVESEGDFLLGIEGDIFKFEIGQFESKTQDIVLENGKRIPLSVAIEIANSRTSYSPKSRNGKKWVEADYKTHSLNLLSSHNQGEGDRLAIGLYGFAKGIVWTGPKESLVGIGTMIRHPITTVKAISHFVARPYDEFERDASKMLSEGWEHGFDTQEAQGVSGFNVITTIATPELLIDDIGRLGYLQKITRSTQTVESVRPVVKVINVAEDLSPAIVRVEDAVSSIAIQSSDVLVSQFDTFGNGRFFHSTAPGNVRPIIDGGFRTDIPNPQAAFHNNRFGRGVYLSDSPFGALAERPGGVVLEVEAHLGRVLDITTRGPIHNADMAKAIARGARKHGYDSIRTLSVRPDGDINTIIFNPKNARATGVTNP